MGGLQKVYLIFNVENAGAILADDEALGEADIIDQLGAELKLAGAADLSIDLYKAEALLFLDNQIIEAADIRRDLLDGVFTLLLEPGKGFRNLFFLLI